MTKLTLKEFKKYQSKDYTIIDTRDLEDFALGFIAGSINIQFDREFEEIASQLLIKNQPMLLVAKPEEEETVLNKLLQLGYSEIIGCLEGGFTTWLNAQEQQDVIISISTEEFGLELKHGNLYLIDIRPEEEFDIMHIDKSFNFDPEILINNYDALDDEITNCIYCLNGKLSMSLISYLKVNEKHNLYHVQGGFNSINKETDILMVATEKKFEPKEEENQN